MRSLVHFRGPREVRAAFAYAAQTLNLYVRIERGFLLHDPQDRTFSLVRIYLKRFKHSRSNAEGTVARLLAGRDHLDSPDTGGPPSPSPGPLFLLCCSSLQSSDSFPNYFVWFAPSLALFDLCSSREKHTTRSLHTHHNLKTQQKKNTSTPKAQTKQEDRSPTYPGSSSLATRSILVFCQIRRFLVMNPLWGGVNLKLPLFPLPCYPDTTCLRAVHMIHTSGSP
ncbi:hypothetical protein J3F83DRAFT_350892 [Trichoderma novae-zelandiae]